ncbi:glucosaminidase domain-containing protein [Kurthia sibirica]|nr:glucosaminidase domain-containing protein [Kurthia sibirica]GEK33880.1 hypothetical protein KSI01_14130 [Kurthia sibirica]
MRKTTQLLLGVFIAIILVVFCGLLLIKQFIPDQVAEVKKPVVSEYKSTEDFINEIGKTAEKVASKYGLYASVMIAQATLESDSGNSELGSEPNYNLFGIKGKFNGQSVLYPTQEDDGKGNMRTINANFRQYPSYEDSMTDYAKLLVNGTSWNKTYYKQTFKSNAATYKEATEALTGRYATDSRYDKKLNALIKQYQLQQYDH